MAKRILGLDPGLAILGFGVIECDATAAADSGSRVSVLDFGIIQTPAHTQTGDRLCTIYQDLHSLLDQWPPDLVAIEKLFFIAWGIPFWWLKLEGW